MAPRDVPAVGGEHLGGVATSEWGTWAPLPTLAMMTLPGIIGWRSPKLRDTFSEVGVEILEERPSHPRPQGALALPTPGELKIPGLIFTPRGVETQLKIFCGDFFVTAARRLHHLVPPHLTIPWFHKPPKHNVAVPINKLEVR